MTKPKSIRFRKTALSNDSNLDIDPDSLTLLQAIEGTKTPLEIAQDTKLPKEALRNSLIKLHKMNLIEKFYEEIPCIDKSLLDTMKEILVGLIGPLGEIVVLDSANLMKNMSRKLARKCLDMSNSRFLKSKCSKLSAQ